MHLSAKSPFNHLNHFNWRMKACAGQSQSDGLHYTSAFAISKKEWPQLKEKLLEFIEQQRKQIQASGTEECAVFGCDLFPI